MAAAASVAEAVAAAKAAVADRLHQSQVDVVLEALTAEEEAHATCFRSMAGFEENFAPWEPELRGVGVSADDCKACGEPIYVFPPSLTNQPDLCPEVDGPGPAFVSPSDYLAPATQPPPGLEPVLAWGACGLAGGFEFGGTLAMGKQAAAPQRRRRRRCQLLLATHLRELEGEDASCIVHVRQIHRLGFRSPELLREYCSRFGQVKRVAVSNAHEKLEDAPRPPFPVRVRPSGIGFVVMERREDAEAVVAEGEIQTIHGYQIRVRRFEAREDKGCDDPEEDASEATTRSPSLADSLADGTLSELSAEADQEREEPH